MEKQKGHQSVPTQQIGIPSTHAPHAAYIPPPVSCRSLSLALSLTEEHQREDEHEGEGLRREHVRDGRADQEADALADDNLSKPEAKKVIHTSGRGLASIQSSGTPGICW